MNISTFGLAIATRNSQRGAVTLFVGIMMLLLVTGITLYGAQVTIFEERTAANNMRAKEAFSAAESGLHQATEYFKSNIVNATSQTTGWMDPANTLWTQCAGDEEAMPCGAEPDPVLRAGMFKYDNGGDLPNMVPPTMGAVNVQALMCFVDDTGGARRCNPTGDSQTSVVTLVATGASADGLGQSQLRESIANYRLITAPPDVPLMAAGVIGGGGTFDVVTAPNGGGLGVPMSAWSSDNVNLANGTPRTCHFGEYYDTGSPTDFDGIQICTTCTCATGLLTSNVAGNYIEGEDIVDVDNDFGVTPDATNFPPDIFEYLFGVPHDLFENVKADAKVYPDCGGLDTSTTGLIWIEGSCSLNSSVASPSAPMLLVVEGDLTINGGGINFFGVAFAFSDPATGVPGGDVRLTGGPRFYGAILSDHDLDFGAGGYQMIYHEDVLVNLANSPDLNRFGVIPGSWSDYLAGD